MTFIIFTFASRKTPKFELLFISYIILQSFDSTSGKSIIAGTYLGIEYVIDTVEEQENDLNICTSSVIVNEFGHRLFLTSVVSIRHLRDFCARNVVVYRPTMNSFDILLISFAN